MPLSQALPLSTNPGHDWLDSCNQAEQRVHQAQLLTQGSSATPGLQCNLTAGPGSQYGKCLLLALPSSARTSEGKGRAPLLHFISCSKKKLCRLPGSSRAVGMLISNNKSRAEVWSVHVHSQACPRSGRSVPSNPPGETCHCATTPKSSAYSVV